MLYEFDIMSTSLPNIVDPNMIPECIEKTSSLSVGVPSYPNNKRLKGINVTFKYAISGDEWAWFCKVRTTNGVVDLMYNPIVFGKPKFGEVCTWLSYWPIGNKLKTGDTLHVSIVEISGLEVHECSMSFVYSNEETLENNIGSEGVEGSTKLVPIAELDEADLGHLKWLKEYQKHEVRLVGDDEHTIGRNCHIQMLYDLGIMSIALPDIKDPSMTPKYISKSSSLSFGVPSYPKNKKLKGINITVKYAMSGDEWDWLCKIRTTNGVVDMMCKPKVYGKPEFGEVCMWLSYWPIGNMLKTGDTVHVSIFEISGLEVHECSVSLVYFDEETLENMGWEESLGGDLSGFQLRTGAYYLCRRDFFELMEVGRLTPDWFRILVGDTSDDSEVRGWRKTGRPKQVHPSFTELKTVRCIIHGPQLEDIYSITEMSKSSSGVTFTSSLLEGGMKTGIGFELIDDTMEELHDKHYNSNDETYTYDMSSFDDIKMEELDPYSHEQKESYNIESEGVSDSPPHGQELKKIVLAVNLSSRTKRFKMMKALRGLKGVESIDYDKKQRILIVIGDVDYVTLGAKAKKIAHTDLLSVGPASELLAKEDKPGYESDSSWMTDTATGEGEKPSSSTSAYTCRLFSLAEIKSATNNFDDKLVLGKGASGTVYKGQISSEETSQVVAIKRWTSMSNQGEREFRVEIDTLYKFHHSHLVSLIGYCYENKEMILVHKFMPNGSLYYHLHVAHTPLSWVARLKIAIGAARGLEYLHTGVSTRHGVMHRNVKSSTILLDENWVAVISGLGMSINGPADPSISHVEASIVGTPGYLDPEYYHTGELTWKSDVYSFGVVLFELLSGRRAIDMRYEEDGYHVVGWAKKCMKERGLHRMVDPNIKGTISTKCLTLFAEMAERCTQLVPEERPTMSELAASLEALLELQEESNLYDESSGKML